MEGVKVAYNVQVLHSDKETFKDIFREEKRTAGELFHDMLKNYENKNSDLKPVA